MRRPLSGAGTNMTEAVVDEDDEADGAAQAFAALEAEVAVLRRAVAALPAAIEAMRAPDYGPTLGAMTQRLEQVGTRLEAIGRHPALLQTPEQHGRAIERAGTDSLRRAVQALGDETEAVKRERLQLAGLVGAVRDQRTHGRERLWVAGIGVAAGLLLFPLLASSMPGGSILAAWASGHADRWSAGWSLIGAADPSEAAALAAASRLVRDNTEALQACTEAARKAGREQRCSVTVNASAR